jgi:CheY-like chemotaxis protein
MHLKNKRVFIVEDNLQNRAIMQTLLEQNGALVAFDRWGVTTVEQLKRFTPVDVILLDLMYPNKITGFDIYKQIRAELEFASVPIIAVSAMDTSIAIPRTQALGFAGFITKPINYERFPRQVASVLNGEPVWYTA